ncbi:MAG: hypothetical protein LBS07_05480 [Prevotellaceae bacterium]|jgi:hypothetical protein|nr:hypothetical protein [Prevotellaceae bacterium]
MAKTTKKQQYEADGWVFTIQSAGIKAERADKTCIGKNWQEVYSVIEGEK